MGFFLQVQPIDPQQHADIAVDPHQFDAVAFRADQPRLEVIRVHFEHGGEGVRQPVLVLFGHRPALQAGGQARQQQCMGRDFADALLEVLAQHLGGGQQVALSGIEQCAAAAAVRTVPHQAHGHDTEGGQQDRELETDAVAVAALHGYSFSGTSPDTMRDQ